MTRYALALLFGGIFLAPSARADWFRANFHAHAANALVDDDGSESPTALHAALRARGFRFSAHTPHSTLASGDDPAARWRRARAAEATLSDDHFTAIVGQELTVAPGPTFQARTSVLGHDAPGNLNHLSIIGSDRFIPSNTPVDEACRSAHQGGGICIVNHPGPGPLMWEEGLWEAPESRGLVDALEIYNGQALAAVGIDFEARYREATSFRGLGVKIAAVTGADTHGPGSVERARTRLRGFGKAAAMLERLAPPDGGERPELDVATLVSAPTASLPSVVAAMKARRTVAVFRMEGVAVDLPGLGETHMTGNVKLHFSVHFPDGHPVGQITLFREGEAIRTWHGVGAVDFAEVIATPTAYVFGARDGVGRLLTSAIWYQPPSAMAP